MRQSYILRGVAQDGGRRRRMNGYRPRHRHRQNPRIIHLVGKAFAAAY
jgi:hypothetical protein